MFATNETACCWHAVAGTVAGARVAPSGWELGQRRRGIIGTISLLSTQFLIDDGIKSLYGSEHFCRPRAKELLRHGGGRNARRFDPALGEFSYDNEPKEAQEVNHPHHPRDVWLLVKAAAVEQLVSRHFGNGEA